MPNQLKDALNSGKIAEVRAAIQADPKGARHPGIINHAAGLAFLAAVELLHKHGADLNASNRNYRPLHNVIQGEPNPHSGGMEPTAARRACLEWLLDHGADPELLGAWPSARAMIIAAFSGKPEFVASLRKHGAKIDGFTGAALGEKKVVAKTIQASPDFPGARDGGVLTALQCAAGSALPKVDTLTIASMLLDAGADPNARTKSWSSEVTAAYFAASPKRRAMFELLLDRGADPTDAVSHAVWGKHFELGEIALAHGAKLDSATANGKPLLNDLIRWGQIPAMLWMLEHGASPNVRDEFGWTATHQAASRGNARMMRAVLDAGGDVTRKDRYSSTPIEVARTAKRPALIEMMGMK